MVTAVSAIKGVDGERAVDTKKKVRDRKDAVDGWSKVVVPRRKRECALVLVVEHHEGGSQGYPESRNIV